MPELADDYEIEVLAAIADVDRRAWDHCAGLDDPFVQHGHLRALEESGSVCEETGFAPRHLLLRDSRGDVVAAAPAYLKTHSLGEIGIDLGFALAHQRACGSYYPKLSVEAPISAMPGQRLLAPAGPERFGLQRMLLWELKALAEREGAASLQISYMGDAEAALAAEAGMLLSRNISYVWRNDNYSDFEDYLAAMIKGRRNTVRRERARVAKNGIAFKWISGADASPDFLEYVADLFAVTFAKYRTDNLHKKAYFRLIGETMSDRVLFCVASKAGAPVAATIFFRRHDGLIASQWGAGEQETFLHFETTIYQGIQRAIEEKLAYFNVGSMGTHKASRGCLPTSARHAFWFCNSDFIEIAQAGLAGKERAAAREHAEQLARSPLKRDRKAAESDA